MKKLNYPTKLLIKVVLILWALSGTCGAIVLLITYHKEAPKSTYKLTYVVYYPDKADTTTVYLKHKARLRSYQGTNYIRVREGVVIATTAIIRVINQEEIKTKK